MTPSSLPVGSDGCINPPGGAMSGRTGGVLCGSIALREDENLRWLLDRSIDSRRTCLPCTASIIVMLVASSVPAWLPTLLYGDTLEREDGATPIVDDDDDDDDDEGDDEGTAL